MNILGIDVSKAKLDCYLSQGIEAKAKPRYQFQVNNDEAGFEQLRKEIARKGFQLELLTVVLEPTSVYHQPLAYWLSGYGVSVCQANPADVRFFAKSLGQYSKNDKLDSFVLAQFGQTRVLKQWIAPSLQISKLDDLMRTRKDIVEDRAAAKVRYDERRKNMNERCVEFLKQTLEHFNAQLKEIDAEIQALLKSDKDLQEQSKLFQTIPGIGPVLAGYLVTLFNGHHFNNGAQVASFCGVIPKEFSSGCSVQGEVRFTKRGPADLRAVLWMGATAILTTRKSSSLKRFYERLLANGKSKACALGALMHKLVLVAFAIWRTRTPYQFTDAYLAASVNSNCLS